LASGGSTAKNGKPTDAERARKQRDREYAKEVRGARKQVKQRQKDKRDELSTQKKADDDKLALINAQIKAARSAQRAAEVDREKAHTSAEKVSKKRDKEYEKEVRLAKKRVADLKGQKDIELANQRKQQAAELALLNARINTKHKKEKAAQKEELRAAKRAAIDFSKQQAFLSTVEKQAEWVSKPLTALDQNLADGKGKRGMGEKYNAQRETLAAAHRGMMKIQGEVESGKYSDRRLVEMKSEMRRFSLAVKDAVQATTSLNRQMSQGSFFARAMGDSFGHFTRSLASFYAVQTGALSIYNQGKQMDSMQASLLASSGSVQQAAKDYAWLEQAANRLGRSLIDGVKGFNGIAQAAKGAGYSAEEAKEVFLAAQEAAVAGSMSNEDAKLTMFALQQMLSKPVVSMEEMQRQLGERYPRAWEAAVNATGKGRGELVKLISDGKLMSKDFVLPLAKEIRKLAKEGGALEAGMGKIISAENRLGNAWTAFAKAIVDAGIGEALKEIFGGLAELLKGLTPAFQALAVVIRGLTLFFGGLIKILDGLLNIIGVELEEVVGLAATLLLMRLVPAVLSAGFAAIFATTANQGWLASFFKLIGAIKIMDSALMLMIRRNPWLFALGTLGAFAAGKALFGDSGATTQSTSGGSSTSVVHDNRRIEVSVNGSGVSDSGQLADMIVEKVKFQMGTGGLYA